MIKYASVDILGVTPAAAVPPRIVRDAHRVAFQYQPRPGYLYVRSRMISSRCNDNYDEFPAEEIEKGWHTFIGKPVFVNHHNADHRKARGVIIDAALHKDANADGSPDTWVEGLMEVDAMSYPKLARALVAGHIERTSMGVDVDCSVCSKCGNKAQTPLDYCQHIPTMKGMKAATRTASGTVRNEIIREKCYGLRFFENSLLVEDPADPTAFFLGKVEAGPGLEHLSMNRTAKAKQFSPSHFNSDSDTSGKTCSRWHCNNPAVATHSIDGGKSTLGVCKKHKDEMDSSKESALSTMKTGAMCMACLSTDTLTFQGSTECTDCGHVHIAGMVYEAKPKYEDAADHPFFQENPVHSDNIVKRWNSATDDEKTSGKNWYSDAHLVAKALGTLHKGPEHPEGNTHLAAGMIANYSAQTGWESNQHNAARALHSGQGIGGKGSGIFATDRQRQTADKMMGGMSHTEALSPSAHKVRDFAHLVEHGDDKDPSDPRAVIDRHALSVATGKRMSDDDYGAFPKSQRHYYGHVVGAYHEAARKISEQSGEPVKAHQVQAVTWLAQQRHNQAGESSETDDKKQRLNKGRERARQKQTTDWHGFRDQHLPDLAASPGTGYTKQSSATPGSRHPFGGSSRVAYGEVKAPPDVDTLRDEECPICGEQDAYNGTECKVCGYVEPPKQFQDPNVDLAKSLDLRKDNADPAQMNGQDVGHLEDALADPDRDGLDDETGEPIDPNDPTGGDGPMLTCPACDSQFEPAAPKSISTAPDPEAEEQAELGQDPTDPDADPEEAEGEEPTGAPAPVEGDVCPVCGQGALMSEKGAEALQAEGPPPTDEDEMPGEVGGPAPGENAPDEEPDGGPGETGDTDEQPDAPARGSSDSDDEDEEPDRSMPADNDADAEEPADEADQDSSKQPVKKSRNPFKQ